MFFQLRALIISDMARWGGDSVGSRLASHGGKQGSNTTCHYMGEKFTYLIMFIAEANKSIETYAHVREGHHYINQPKG